MTLDDVLRSRGLIDESGCVKNYVKSDKYNDIFKVVVDFCLMTAAKGTFLGGNDSAVSMDCEFDDKFSEELFCIFVRGFCNAVVADSISFQIDTFCLSCFKKCDDRICDRLCLLSILLKKLLVNGDADDLIKSLEEIVSISSVLCHYEISNYCNDVVNKTINIIQRLQMSEGEERSLKIE